MLGMYLLACVPVIIGAVLWVKSKQIVWWEWLVSAALAFAVSGTVHTLVIRGMTRDQEVWSGQVVQVTFHPEWVEEYEEAVYKTETYTTTTGFGKNRRTVTRTRRVFSHYVTKHRTHHEFWDARVNYGKKNETYRVDKKYYAEVKSKWGGQECETAVPGDRPGFDSGDRNDYVLHRKTDYIYPASMMVTFENRVKAAPSVFSFSKVPEGAKVHNYPSTANWRRSGRLLGLAQASIPILEWDRMNSRLGPVKKVNVILIGFGAEPSTTAHLQEAKWVGGKKNDLVLCYGGDSSKTDWAYVFGWTEKALVKRNLETILMRGPVDETIIPKIEQEIIENYQIKEWEKFSYISVEPPWWAYLVLLGVLALTQSGFFVWAIVNDFKEAK